MVPTLAKSYVAYGVRVASGLRLHLQQVVNGRVFVAAVCFQHRLDHFDLYVREHVVHVRDVLIRDWPGRGRLWLWRLTCTGRNS